MDAQILRSGETVALLVRLTSFDVFEHGNGFVSFCLQAFDSADHSCLTLMAPKKMGYSASSSTDAGNNTQPTEDTSSDVIIARVLQQLEELDIQDVDSTSVKSLVEKTKEVVKKYNNKDKVVLTPEERVQERIAKAKARALEKQEEGARLRSEKIVLTLTNGTDTYTITVVRGTTVGTLRLMLGQQMGIGRTKALRLSLTRGATIITSSPRKTLLRLNIQSGETIYFSVTQTGEPDDDTTVVSQDTVDVMVARDIIEDEEDSNDDMSVNNEGIDEDADEDEIQPSKKK